MVTVVVFSPSRPLRSNWSLAFLQNDRAERERNVVDLEQDCREKFTLVCVVMSCVVV